MNKMTLGLVAALALVAGPALAEDRVIEGAEIASACAGDVVKLCAGVIPGEGRVKACVKNSLSKLSQSCRDTIAHEVSAQVPQDGAQAKMTRIGGLNDYRYCEIFLIGGNPFDLEGAVYNTTELNLGADKTDSCPDALWSKVDPKKLKDEYHLLGVFKNGPRHWMYDWIETPIGAEKDLSGLKVRWINYVQLPPDMFKQGSTFYKPTTVERKSKQGYAKGQAIFILDDPEGTPWVMQAYSLIVDPTLKFDDLKTLGTKLKLPPGWKYRWKVLDQDMEIHAINGTARIVQDDLEGTYNACFTQGGEAACSIQP